MDLFHIALFLHIIALVVAGGVTAITKLAASRRARARTVGDALDWHNVLIGAAKIFPICIAVFVITGGYMLSVNKIPMSAGFIVAGLAGSVWLLATGAFLGAKGKGLGQMLAGLAAKGPDQPAPRLVPPPAAVMLPTWPKAIAATCAPVPRRNVPPWSSSRPSVLAAELAAGRLGTSTPWTTRSQ